jgi:trans-aconitate 2-methyltransferase
MEKAGAHYTFGDGRAAGERLRRLAELYEPEARRLLAEVEQGQALAVDLGCGPGWTTELLHELAQPERTVGLDASASYVAAASTRAPHGVCYYVHDVTRAPFPCGRIDVLFCRFLLTHLADPAAALNIWADVARPGARLYIHETAHLKTDHPTLAQYYAWVGELQAHYGQSLRIGAELDEHFDPRRWRIVRSELIETCKPAQLMADLHLRNLTTWSHDSFIRGRHTPEDVAQLEQALGRIVSGAESADDVRNGCRHIIAEVR